jgi:hypothetical protein
MRRATFYVLAGGLLAVSLAGGLRALAQTPDAALKDRVMQLVERLDAPKADARDAAEAALIKLGSKVLPLLPEPAKVKSAEVKKRIEKIRSEIADAQEKANVGPSIITIKGQGIRLSEALKQLQTQSGNTITDLREQNGAEATNPALDLDIDKKLFFEALDEIVEKAGLTLNFFTGDGSIGLMAGAAMEGPQTAEKAPKGPAPPKPLKIYSGPFRILFKQILVSKDLQTGAGQGNAQFEVAWEPRLRPMLLALKAEELEIQDDQGNFLDAAVMQESSSVVLRHENPVAELNLNIDAPQRKALSLKSIKVKADITVPSGIRAFRFPSLAAKETSLKQGDVSVKLEGTDVDEGTWKIRVELGYSEQGPAFESYRQGLFNNRIYLQKADGSRYEHTGSNGGGFNQTGNDGGVLGFEYLYVDLPGKPADYQLVYETPSKVLPIPVTFEFKDVPLP